MKGGSMKRYTINHCPLSTVEATLVKKTVHSYHPDPVTNSTATPIYELQFATEKGLLTFEIDAFGYQTIPKGTKSVLTYQGYELISFKGWYPVEQKSA